MNYGNYKMVDDCIVLLSYVSKHRDEPQSLRILSEATNVPVMTVVHLLTDCQEVLRHAAETYGYDVWVADSFPAKCQFDRSKLIDAVKLLDKY